MMELLRRFLCGLGWTTVCDEEGPEEKARRIAEEAAYRERVLAQMRARAELLRGGRRG